MGLDWRKQVACGVFIVLALILFAYSIHLYNEDQNDYTSLLNLSSEQLTALQRCAPEEASTLAQINAGLTCAPPSERKHSIVLLSSYPNEDANVFRRVYEASTGISSYSPYLQIDDSHSHACSFQSGPWELYCRGSPKCAFQHPPPWEIPYFVKTSFPIYDMMCDIYGYDLPTHDGVLHIVHNPIDAIYGWYATQTNLPSTASETNGTSEISSFIYEYAEWQRYWRNYEYIYPDASVSWIRYEDYCICQEEIFETVLQVSGIHGLNSTQLLKAIEVFPCDTSEELGAGLPIFSRDDLALVGETMLEFVHHFGYDELFLEMIEHHHRGTSEDLTNNDILVDALYPQLNGKPPSDGFCKNLAAKSWHWEGLLG